MSFVDFVGDYGVVILLVVVEILLIGFFGFLCYCGWAENDAGESVVLRDGSQSYSCVVSRVDKTPHNCKPIVEGK